MTPLSIVVPRYNEREVLPEIAKRQLVLIDHLQAQGKVGGNSHVLFVDDGSRNLVNYRELRALVGTYRTRQAAECCRILILVARSTTLAALVYAISSVALRADIL